MKPLGWEWKHFEVSAPKISYHRFNPPCNDDLDKWASWQTLYRPSKYWIDSFLRAFFSDLQKLWISGKSGLQICKVKLEFAQKIVLKMCNDSLLGESAVVRVTCCASISWTNVSLTYWLFNNRYVFLSPRDLNPGIIPLDQRVTKLL